MAPSSVKEAHKVSRATCREPSQSGFSLASTGQNTLYGSRSEKPSQGVAMGWKPLAYSLFAFRMSSTGPALLLSPPRMGA